MLSLGRRSVVRWAAVRPAPPAAPLRQLQLAVPVPTAAAAAADGGRILVADKGVAYWLLGTAGAVFGMVCLGGVTRLTKSGLSMTEWKLQGTRLPSDDVAWEAEFAKYRASPEYSAINQGMGLEEFKFIYFMEWAHRMWGRGLGFAFGLPLLYFGARGRLSAARHPGLAGRLVGLFALGGAQGLIGWWMVKSGLEKPKAAHNEPKVSPYRLATHMTMAVGLYSGLVWTGLSVLHPNSRSRAADGAAGLSKTLRLLKARGGVASALIGATLVSGCFVAGNDAGLAFNDWPMYAGRAVPEGVWDEDMSWRNVFENTATVQFDHRMLAYATLASVGAVALAARRPPSAALTAAAGGGAEATTWAALPAPVRLGVGAMGGVVCCQAALGITTLLLYVPVPLASLHQAGALTLWTSGVYLQHALRYARP